MDLAHTASSPPTTDGFQFGGDQNALAAQLRLLADKIEKKDVMVTQVRLIQRVTPSDFYSQSLVVRFVEKP